MKIKKLKLTNFMVFKSKEIDFDSENASIYGANAAGKTTVATAINWLLFDKNNENKKDFGIKTRINEIEMSKAEHEVIGVFDIDGTEVELKKVYHEVWTKPHGKLQEEFKGHTSDYFIDNVPKTATKFKKYIAEICDEETFKLLTNPRHFSEILSWEKRREILLEICGVATNKEVIATNAAFKEVPVILNGQTIKDTKAVLKAAINKIKKEITSIPARISENDRAITNTEAPKNLQDELNELIEKVTSINENIAEIKNGGESIKLRTRLTEVKELISSKKREADNELRKNTMAVEKKLDKAKDDKSDLVKASDKLEIQIANLNQKIEDCVADRDGFAKEFREVKKSVFADDGICPTCGQKLPEDEIEKAKETFNLNKADQLKQVQKLGKENNEKKADLEKELAELKEIETANEFKINKAQLIVQGFEDELAKVFESRDINIEIGALKIEEIKLQEDLSAPDETKDESIKAAETKKTELETLILEKRSIIAKVEADKSIKARIKELEKQEEDLNAEYEENARKLYLLEEFERAAVTLTTKKVEGKFELAKFTLFKDNISNDGVEACCQVTYKGVPYGEGLNKAMRTNIGLDIIKTLQKHYNFEAPIIIDDAEGVTKLIDMGNTQIIRLVVSAADKTLRIEKENK